MKKFLTRILVYILIEFAAVLMVILFFSRRKPADFLFVSNSASYNLKAGFVRKKAEKFRDARMLIFGSSMSMNNINAKMIQDSLHLPTINLASFALTIADFQHSRIWDEGKVYFSNTQFGDFGPPLVKIKDQYSFNTTRVNELMNIMFDFSTFRQQLEDFKTFRYLSDPLNKSYLSCNFDECGSVLFNDTGFAIDTSRWNKDYFVVNKVDSAAITNYVSELKTMVQAHQSRDRFIISFSPARHVFYSAARSQIVSYLGNLIRQNCPNVYFIDEYDRDYPDSDYVDNAHFNKRGANRYTSEIIDSITTQRMLP